MKGLFFSCLVLVSLSALATDNASGDHGGGTVAEPAVEATGPKDSCGARSRVDFSFKGHGAFSWTTYSLNASFDGGKMEIFTNLGPNRRAVIDTEDHHLQYKETGLRGRGANAYTDPTGYVNWLNSLDGIFLQRVERHIRATDPSRQEKLDGIRCIRSKLSAEANYVRKYIQSTGTVVVEQ